MKRNFYITTPIYYPSDNLHIGHAYTTVTCDAIARYKRLRGYNVYFLTGSDEHGEKIERIANEKGVSPLEYTDKIVLGFQDLWQKLGISNDDFIRTTQARHQECVQHIFTHLLEQGDIYKGEYEGKYCIPCESYWTEAQLVDGKCPDCNREVEQRVEESYFFKMSKYAQRLVKYYDEHPEFIEPISRKNEMMNNFILPGLEDLSVSRSNFSWGIPVKEDPNHVVYVWIDALANYLSALGYPDTNNQLFRDFWHEDTQILQVVGKEIVRFHTIYWPIMLMALNLRLPDKVFAHGWIIMKDGKMSKSKGNVVDPNKLIERYSRDALRHYCLSQISLGQDGTFTPELFIGCLNTDLANNLGNLVNRTIGMIQKYFGGNIHKPIVSTEFDEQLIQDAQKMVSEYEKYMDEYKVDKASNEVFNFISLLNKYIDDTQPWILAKDENSKEMLNTVLYNLVAGLRQAAIVLKPFLIDMSQQIIEQLNIPEQLTSYDSLKEYQNIEELTVNKASVIFNRLDLDEELSFFNGEVNEA